MWWSQKTAVAYYEQGAEERLDAGLTVLETVRLKASGYTDNELKGILGTFLFPGDDVEKRVAVLSGGERSRLAIIGALLTPSNLLILDEPTNHLDIQSREVLFQAISRYRKTLVFAAHDRFMLDRLADKTVSVESGRVTLFPGNYSYASRHSAPRTEPESGPTPAEPEVTGRRKPARQAPVSNPVPQLMERRKRAEQEYDAARERFDLNRARELAQEVRDIDAEIARVKAEQVMEEERSGGGS